MYSVDQIKNLLFDAVINRDIKQIAEVAYEVGQTPVFILDSNSYVLAQQPSHPIGNPIFDETLSKGRIPYHYYEKLANDAIFEYTHKRRDVSLLNWGLHKSAPHFYAPIYIDGFHAAGISFICKEDFAPQEYDYAVMDLLSKAVGACVEMVPSCFKAKNAYLMAQVFIDGHLSPENKAALVKYFKIDPQKKYSLMVAQPKDGGKQRTAILHHVCDYIENNIMNVITLTADQQITMLIYNINGNTNDRSIGEHPAIKAISDYLHAMDLEFGISQLFNELENARHYKEQAAAAINLGKQLDSAKTGYQFQDYSNYYIAQHLLTAAHPELFLHPAFIQLVETDKKHKTCYIETLIAYLENEQEVSKTAQFLNIHKSTLVYRIQKIQDLASIDFDNPNICTQLMINKCMYDLKYHKI